MKRNKNVISQISHWLLEVNFASNQVTTIMFGSTVIKIDFSRIDSEKLIITKIKLKKKWFMFGYIHVNVSWTKKFECKNQF
jgi:hypothetical protein